MVQANSYDLIIVGGGMVGASLLCALLPSVKRYGLKVAIVEAFPLGKPKGINEYQPSYDARSTALSWSSRNILKKLGLWEKLSRRATPIKNIHASDRGHFGAVRMNAAEYNLDALGYVVENASLGQVLIDAVQQSGDVDFLCPARVSKIETIESGSRLTIESDGKASQVEAGLVVVADGGRSELCQQLRIDWESHNYHQHAIIANITTQQPHGNVAYERFTGDGPIALLPLDDASHPATQQCRSAMVFTVPEQEVERLMAISNSEFIDVVQDRFGFRLGRITQIGERFDYPLVLQHAKDQVRAGIVVVGNAAHTLHPVAGQGFNLALRGVYELAASIRRACEASKRPGSIEVLQGYLESRQKDQEQTIALSDQMVRLFSNDDLLLSQFRNLGLLALELVPPAKKLFAHQAMGFAKSGASGVSTRNQPDG